MTHLLIYRKLKKYVTTKFQTTKKQRANPLFATCKTKKNLNHCKINKRFRLDLRKTACRRVRLADLGKRLQRRLGNLLGFF